ncbi:MAG: PKD domain-containing protein, partial [Bacteroidetes bacterium]|nr:PKD domain-containing protein [Bacteroidota bacterium]
MTIYQMFPGTYQYYIYNYSGSPEITTSNAVIQIYNQTGLIQTMQIPTTGTGRYWYVCDVNGSNGQLTYKNIIQQAPPGNLKFNMPEKKTEETRNITSWMWNFGDGTTSTVQNPTKVYNSPGTYTVSLTVGNGITTAT